MGRCHITREPNAPASAPLASGDHFVDTSTNETYLSVGTASVADWVKVETIVDTDIKVAVSSDDTTAGYLEDKVTAGSTKVSLTTLNPGGDEDLEIDIAEANIDHDQLLNFVTDEHTDAQVKASLNDSTPNYLEDKVVAGSTKVSVTTLNDGADEDVSIDVNEANVDHDALLNFVTDEHTDAQVKASLNDATPNYLEDKIVAGSTKIAVTTLNDGADEDVSIDVNEANVDHDALLNYVAGEHTDAQVKVTSNDTTPGYLFSKLAAGTNIVLTEQNDGANETILIDASGDGGETNTASNAGAGGVGLFDAKVGVDLEFRNINAASTKISVALDAGNKEVDIDVAEANVDHDQLLNFVTDEHTDAQVKASLNDSTPNYLEDKIVAGSTKVSVTTLNDGADEDVAVDINEANVDHDALLNYVAGEHTDAQVKASLNDTTPNYLEDKIVAGSTKISVTTLNDGADEDVSVDVAEANVNHDALLNYVAGEHTDAQAKVSLNDTTPDYLENKIIAGSTKVSVTTLNDGGDEDISVDISEANINHDALLNYIAGEHTDAQVKASLNDTTPNYLEDKIVAGSTKISVTTLNDGADEDVSVDLVEANVNHDALLNYIAGEHTDAQVKVTSNDTTPDYLFSKLVAGTNITLTEQNDGANENILIDASGGDFGAGFTFTESLGASSTTSATYIEKVSLSTGSVPAGDYIIIWSFGMGNSNNTKVSGFRIQLDNTTNLQEGEISTPNGGTYGPAGGHAIVTLTAATHTIDIDYLAVTNTALIRNARITFWRVS